MHLCLPAEFEPARAAASTCHRLDRPAHARGRVALARADRARQKSPRQSCASAPPATPASSSSGPCRPVADAFARNGFATTRSPHDGDALPPARIRWPRAPVVPRDACHRFAVMDPAGTEKSQNAHACYTVIQVWDITPAHDMLLVHQYREQVQTPDAVAAAVRDRPRVRGGLHRDRERRHRPRHRPDHPPQPASRQARSKPAAARKPAAKSPRSAWPPALVYFPAKRPSSGISSRSCCIFPNSQYADQVDALSHAAMQVQRLSGPPTVQIADVEGHRQESADDGSPSDSTALDGEDDGWRSIEV